jgi:poly(3-hydroxybutyrate) depolymerase
MQQPALARMALTAMAAAALFSACVPSTTNVAKDPPANAGGTGGGRPGESGGSGGQPQGSGGQSGAGAGGATTGSGGQSAGGSGGTGSGGVAAGGTSGQAGAGSGGAAGAPADADPGDSAAPPAAGGKPSAGCGQPNPPTGARMFVSQGKNVPYLISVPPGYDNKKPIPLAFALHGYGRTHLDCRSDDCPKMQEVMGDKTVLVFLKSIGAGWETDTREQNLQAFGEILTSLKKEYCVDENKVFVAGTSSGAAFTNVLGCKYGDVLRLVVPVAGPADNTGCKGNPAALVIHGTSDGVARGENARNLYAQRNGCTMTTVPPLAEIKTKITTARAAKMGDIACARYQGCTKAPVGWCEHSFGGYNNTTHGWPDPAAQIIWDLVKELP